MTAQGTAAGASSIIELERLELAFAPQAWPFADERRDAIDRHFAKLQHEKPALWNGRMLLLAEHSIEHGVLRGAFLETDFASFVAWRDWGFPETGICNCFAMGALRGSDGAFLLGVMAPHTVNAGRIYFPAGVPDPSDIVDGMVDLGRNVRREVAEETGLIPSDYDTEPGWTAVRTGPRLALIKRLKARADADTLSASVRTHLARDAAPELSHIRIVRGVADLDPMMPPFVTAFLEHQWSLPA